jgi:hypothetical protein
MPSAEQLRPANARGREYFNRDMKPNMGVVEALKGE